MLTPTSDGTAQRMSHVKNDGKKAFFPYFQNIIKAVDMNLNWNWSIKLQTGLFSAKYDHISTTDLSICNLSPLFGGDFAYLKVVPAIFLLVCFVCLKKSTCETWKCFLFHFESSFHSSDIQILNFQIFKCHDIIKCL